MDNFFGESLLLPLTKISFLKERFQSLATSPAWGGQIELITAPEDETRATIQAKNRFVRDWVRENFLAQIEKELAELPGPELLIQLVVHASKNSSRAKAPEPVEVILKPQHVNQPLFHESLKAKYNFDSFVVGNSNQFAHAAARAVGKLPGKNYNPLFIYGGVGLGKTHLLNAIGLEILKNNPRSRIIYLSSEKFMNELIHCIRFEKMGEFRKKYRDNCDVLLIDDIQFIAGKERTQEEFFHTFNHLYDHQKQIVLTSDKTPREIPGLEERLRSRFEWGLLADIQVPDLETRIAILKRKADEDGIIVEDDVALFLASNVKSNVRELEGSLIRLNAFSSLNQIPLTVDLARDVMKNVLGGVDRVLTVEQIQKLVADFYKIKLGELTGKCRVKSLALPRQIAMYLCRKYIHSSYPEIGHKFGGKDHTTVLHACNKIENDLKQNAMLRDQITHIEQSLSRF